MEKIARRVYESSSDVNIWITRLLQQVYENQDKLNEMVDWINKHERQRIERLDIVEDYVNALIQDYKRRHKAKGTEDEKHSQKR